MRRAATLITSIFQNLLLLEFVNLASCLPRQFHAIEGRAQDLVIFLINELFGNESMLLNIFPLPNVEDLLRRMISYALARRIEK